MQESRSIAAATATLRRVLLEGMPKRDVALAQVDVTSLPPDKVNVNVDRPTLNLFLYRAAITSSLPVPSSGLGAQPTRPADDLVLEYLLTAYGRVDEDAGDLSHRVLGAAMAALQEFPILLASDAQSPARAHGSLPMMHDLHMLPLATSLQEMATIWSLFQTNYRLSSAYEVRVLRAMGDHASAD